jgi:hypothetical protein
MAKHEKGENGHQVDEAKSTEKTVKVERTPEELAAIEAKQTARKEARARVLQFVKDNTANLGPIAADILSFVGKQSSPKVTGVSRSINSDLRDAFLAAGDSGLTEMDIFRQFKIGRPEMVTKIRILVLCPNPTDRVWVKFNEATETYHIVGLGAEPPAGWDGYIPSAKTL